MIDDLMNRRTDPYSVVEKVMADQLERSLKTANSKMKNANLENLRILQFVLFILHFALSPFRGEDLS